VVGAPSLEAAVKKDLTEAAPLHIPAFHELQKKGPTIRQEAPIVATPHKPPSEKKITVRAKKRDLNKKIVAPGGTVITDTMRARKQLARPSLLATFSQWLKELFAGSKKTAPIYTVSDTERRRDIIEKATSKSGAIFTADSDTLKEEIRRRKVPGQEPLIETPTAPPVTEPYEHLSWSPNTESGYALLTETSSTKREPPSQRVAIDFKKPSIPQPHFAPVVPQPTPMTPKMVDPASRFMVPPSLNLPRDPEKTGYWDSELPAKKPLPPTWPTPTAPARAYEPVREEEPTPPPIIPSDPSPTPPRTPAQHASWFSELAKATHITTNTLTVSITAALLGLVAVIFIIRAVITMTLPALNPEAPVPEGVAILPDASIVDASLSALTNDALNAALQTVPRGENGSLVEMRLVDATGVPLPTDTVLALLGFTGNQNLNRAVVTVHVAHINTRRGIVLKVTDATTVFGALLAWEPTLATDLGATLGIATPVTASFFGDQTLGNTDVRILTADGIQLVTYGFIAKDVVLITKDVAGFSAALGSN
jgi:hypothetical protein